MSLLRSSARFAAPAVLALFAGGAPALGTPALCQDDGSADDTPQVRPTRLESGMTIVVDGDLSEAAWAGAVRLGTLTVTEPIEGAKPLYPTDVMLAYDADTLYIGVICYDDPKEVRALQRTRDAYVRFDDVIEFWVDTFADQRFAFWFQITAGGSRGDALLADSGSFFSKDWDGIWYGRSKLTEEGWQAEIALPLKTLAFDVNTSAWGFNLRRKRIANGEDARWANPSVAYRFFSLEEGGEIVGMEGLRQGKGLDLVPYVKGGYRDDSHSGGGGSSSTDVGLDLTWRPTPAMNVRLTTNTDFAETEVDDRQVNLTRFPLFFPEKRDFFLEDAGMFEFGPSSSRFGRGGRGGGVRPFYSRSIGRDAAGAAVPILAGVKVTGRMGPWNVGMLETRQGASFTNGTEVSERTLGVVRLSRNLGGENSAGVILTHGRPDGEGDALTAGADFRLGSSRFFGPGQSGSLWGYYMATHNEGTPSAASWGMKAQARSSTWENTLDVASSEEGFDPLLGFQRRSGVDHHRYVSRYTWRGTHGDLFRTYKASISPHFDQDRTGDEDLFDVPLRWLDVELWSEDSISIETKRVIETLDTGFPLSDDLFVNPGDFTMTRHVLELRSNQRRSISGSLRVEWGDYYSGDILRTRISPIVLPSALLNWSVSFEDIRIDLAEGNLDTQLMSTNLNLAFDPDLSWTNNVQYDSQSRDMSWQSRLHWIVEPGQDLYLVGLAGWDKTGRESFARTSNEIALKMTYTWRF